jgi:hypothetical protein
LASAVASRPIGERLASAVASRIASAAPEKRPAIPLHGIDPVKLASAVNERLERIAKERPITPEALASKLASQIASKLASPQVLASQRVFARFNQRLASKLLSTASAVPSETVNAAGLTGGASAPKKG